MACLNADGSLTVVAGSILQALATTGQADAIAAATGLPLYRVRGGLRELTAAGVIEVRDTGHVLTERGRGLLARVAAPG